ncbi:LysR substrate-binding domain-containing protein [Burkholderia alba]|uniref:LysR substrate-binding domain-containing protein n=1 Tax=Burkholderia alba TaxID=2683677 RepID=UPI002B05ED3E|nr:LysR substrate-binding domain-containing protein [Burkholderia alba]
MVRDLDSSLLRTFLVVAETGSISEAADVLHRTQAAVSMALRRLEEELGRRLLDRSSRGVKLTAAGGMLLPYAQKMLGIGIAARAALDAGQVSGTVRLGVLEDIAVGHLPHALRRFAAAFPDVALEIVVAASPALSQALANRALDLIIGDPGLVAATPIAAWRHPLHWAAGPTFEHDPNRGPLPLVAFGGTCLWQDRWLAGLRQAGIAWRVVCTSTSLSAMQSAVEAGLGVAILLERNIRSDSMRVLEPASVGLPVPPFAEFGLFSHGDLAGCASAVQALQTYLFHELRLGSADIAMRDATAHA